MAAQRNFPRRDDPAQGARPDFARNFMGDDKFGSYPAEEVIKLGKVVAAKCDDANTVALMGTWSKDDVYRWIMTKPQINQGMMEMKRLSEALFAQSVVGVQLLNLVWAKRTDLASRFEIAENDVKLLQTCVLNLRACEERQRPCPLIDPAVLTPDERKRGVRVDPTLPLPGDNKDGVQFALKLQVDDVYRWACMQNKSGAGLESVAVQLYDGKVEGRRLLELGRMSESELMLALEVSPSIARSLRECIAKLRSCTPDDNTIDKSITLPGQDIFYFFYCIVTSLLSVCC